jgi:uncharacterized membrane protein required for colicin V production
VGIYDIAMLIVVGGAIWFGYWKGLAWQVASLAAIIVSYVVAVNFRDQVAGFIQADEPWNRIGAMLVLFLGTSLIIWTIYASVAKSLKKHELKGFDRQAGAMLGAVKGALLCMVITMFAVSLLGEKAHNAIDNSKLGPYVETGIWKVSAFVPAELAKYVDPHIQSYKEASGHGAPVIDPNGNGFFGTNSYPVGQQPYGQNPNQLPPSNPAYSGQWQTPPPGGYNNNQAAPGNQYNYQYGQQPTNTATPYGTQPGTYYGGGLTTGQPASNQTANGANATGNNNGWPNINVSPEGWPTLNVNSKEALDAAARAAADAARRAFENPTR